MNWLLFLSGAVLCLSAVHFDPWGKSGWAAAQFLFGASVLIWALVT